MTISGNFNKPDYKPHESQKNDEIESIEPQKDHKSDVEGQDVGGISNEGQPDSGDDDFDHFKKTESNIDVFETLAERARLLSGKDINGDDIKKAQAYVQEHIEEIEKEFSEEVQKPDGSHYIVMGLHETGLKYNIEFHGRGTDNVPRAYLRYDSNYIQGKTKSASRGIDLYNLELVVKAKITRIRLKKDLEKLKKEEKKVQKGAQKYAEVRNHFLESKGKPFKDVYTTYPITIQMAFEEMALGRKVDDVLKIRHFALYTKEILSMNDESFKIDRIGIYTLQQDGVIVARHFKDDKERLQVAAGMIRNIANLHRAQIVHNDIKGDNFLWTRSDKIETKVIDLGLSTKMKSVREYTNSSVLPPEILRGERIPANAPLQLIISRNTAKDAWALGEAILRDVYGTTFWPSVNSSNPPEAIQKSLDLMNIPQHLWKFPKSIPVELKEVIIGLLSINPNERMTPIEADEFMKALLGS